MIERREQYVTPKADRHQPAWVCYDCGIRYGRHTLHAGVSTWHLGTCEVCESERPVTEPRDFGYLRLWRRVRANQTPQASQSQEPQGNTQ